ncbi:hypothetical protein Tco_0363665 [Tanacetum coccineum]
MVIIVPDEGINVEALQTKYPIIGWEVNFEDTMQFWKIIRVGNHTKVYQVFEYMLKNFDRDDLVKLWSLVQERYNSSGLTEDKEIELWVKLKMLFEPDAENLLELQKYMHDPLKCKELASPKQTALGKNISNPLIVDSLLKTIWLSMHHVIAMKHWLFQSKRLLIYSMAGEDEFHDDNPPPVTPTQQAPHTLSTIKLPILKKGEYDIWAMKMEHYLGHTDYPIWEVIQKGNGPVQVSTDTNGQIRVLPPKTAEEILARERERKARTTLLMSIPEDHLAKFHKMNDAKDMWEDIKSRFGGNDESKKMQKYILKQQFEGFSVSNSEGLQKGYDRFQSLLSQLKIHGAGVSTEDTNQKFLRVFESDIKGSTVSSSSTHNVAFIFSESTNSTNDVSTAYGVSTSSGHNSQKEGSSSYTDELKRDAFEMASSHVFYEIKEVLQEDREKAVEELKALVTLNGDGVDWTGHAEDKEENFALMAHSNSGSNTEVTSCSKECQESYAKLKKLYDEQSRSSDVEDSPVNDRFAKVEGMHAVPPPLTGIYMPSKSDFGIDKSNFTYGPKQSKTSESDAKTSDFDSCETNSSVETLESVPEPVVVEPKVVSQIKVWSDAPIIEEYESDSDDEYVIKPSKEQEKPILTILLEIVISMRKMAKQFKLNKQKGKATGQGENRPVWNNVQILNHQTSLFQKQHMTGNKAYLAKYQDYNGGLVAFGGVSTAFNISTTSKPEVSTTTPITPPTTSVFEDQDIFLVDALVMLSDKAKLKGVEIKEKKDAERLARSVLALKPLLKIDLKDKGKGVLEEEPELVKVKSKDQGKAQIERDVEIALKVQAELDEEARLER